MIRTSRASAKGAATVPRSEPVVTCSRVDGVEVILVKGELDLARRDELRDCLENAFAERLPVVVDLKECELIDSSGIAVLIHAARKLNGGWGLGFALAVADGEASRMLRLTGLDRVIDSYPSTEDAVGALTGEDR
jgi:anti-sigma B factor antagonist